MAGLMDILGTTVTPPAPVRLPAQMAMIQPPAQGPVAPPLQGPPLPPLQGPTMPRALPNAAVDEYGRVAGDGTGPTLPQIMSHYVSPVATRMVNTGAVNLDQGNVGTGLGQIVGGGLGQAAFMAATPAADTVKAIGALGAGVGHFMGGLVDSGAVPAALPAQVAAQPAHPASAPAPVLHSNQLVVRNPDGTHSLLPQFSRTAPTAAEAAAYAAANPPLPTNADLAAGGMRVAGDTPYTGATAGGGLVAGRYIAPVPAAPTRAIPGTPLSERELAAAAQIAPKGTPIDFLQRMPHGTAGQLARLGLLTNQRGAQVTTQGVEDVQTAKNTVTGSLQKQVNDLQKQLLADPNNADLKGRYQGAVDLQARTLGTLYYPQGFLAGGMGGFGGVQ